MRGFEFDDKWDILVLLCLNLIYFCCFFNRLFFHSLIKPIKWPHPMIMALPESLEELLYSPTPIILGIHEVQNKFN